MSDGKDEHLKAYPDAMVMDADEDSVLIGLKVGRQWLEKNPKFLDQLKQLGRNG